MSIAATMTAPTSLSTSSNVRPKLLLPLSKRPKLKVLNLQKKRPQSLSSTVPTASSSSSSSFTTRITVTSDNNAVKRTKGEEMGMNDKSLSWNVGDSIDSLLDIPLFHVSPMTSLVVKRTDHDTDTDTDNSSIISPNQITSKITQFVSSISAIGDYNSRKACATIHTIDSVIFTIQLFKTQDHEHILIEMERKKGDTIQYHYLASAILNLVKGIKCESIHLYTNASYYEPLQQHHTHQEDNEETVNLTQITMPSAEDSSSNKIKFQEAMESICTLLQKDRMDAMLLGMESLRSMTNYEASSNKEITSLFVNSILQDGEWQVVKDCIFDIAQSGDQNENSITSTDEDTKLHLEVEYKQKMIQLSLEIVANCISFFLVSHRPLELRRILENNLNEWKDFLSTLRLRTNCNKNELQRSYQAARCIYTLVSFSPDMRVDALNSSLYEVVADYQQHDNTQCIHPGLTAMMEEIAEIIMYCK